MAAVAGSYQARYIEVNHPEVSLHMVADRTEYLMALMRDEVVAIIEEVPTMNAMLAKFGLTGSVSRRMDLFENQVYAGVRNDNTALLEKSPVCFTALVDAFTICHGFTIGIGIIWGKVRILFYPFLPC